LEKIQQCKKDKQLNLIDNGIKIIFDANDKEELLFFKFKNRDKFFDQLVA